MSARNGHADAARLTEAERTARILADMPTGDQFELPSYADQMRAAQVRDMTAPNGGRK